MADDWKKDISEDFINLAELSPSIVTHMLNAVHTSFYKYGSVWEKSETTLRQYRANTLQKWADTRNSEKLVDAINYDMFLYMFDGQREHVESAKKLASLYREEDYKGTDSTDSVTRIRKTVSDWLREDLLNDVHAYNVDVR